MKHITTSLSIATDNIILSSLGEQSLRRTEMSGILPYSPLGLLFLLLGTLTTRAFHQCHQPLPPRLPVQHSTNLDGDYNDIEEFGTGRDPLFQLRSSRWVIIVDDEEPIRKAVGQLLFDKGYQVTACADGSSALKVALSRRVDQGDGNEASFPDCIVSDVRMPGMDGIELLRCVRSNENLLEVPVVLLTAKGMTNDRIAGYDAGADAYLPKPFDPDELVAIVDNVIDRHVTLSGSSVQVDDLKRDLDEIKYLLLEKGGGGVGNGWVEQTNVFLAPDEREILELLCQGLTTKEMAEKTFLSTRRVEQLLTRMFRKTDVKNRTELVRWAMATGNVRL